MKQDNPQPYRRYLKKRGELPQESGSGSAITVRGVLVGTGVKHLSRQEI